MGMTDSEIHSFSQWSIRTDCYKCYMCLYCCVTGIAEIPEKLPHALVNLQRLNLSCNMLTEESFPESFKYLTTLLELNLTSNSLTTIPSCILALSRLQRLYLGEWDSKWYNLNYSVYDMTIWSLYHWSGPSYCNPLFYFFHSHMK